MNTLTLNIALCFFTQKFIIIVLVPSSPARGDPLGILQIFPSFVSITNFSSSVFTTLQCLMLDPQKIYPCSWKLWWACDKLQKWGISSVLLYFATGLELCKYMTIPAFIKENKPMKQEHPPLSPPPFRPQSCPAPVAWSQRWPGESPGCSQCLAKAIPQWGTPAKFSFLSHWEPKMFHTLLDLAEIILWIQRLLWWGLNG